MNSKNVVLLGGSNSVMVNGLQKGLREGIIKYNQDENRTCNLEFYNFALGGTSSIQKLYEIKRVRNSNIISNAELIIMESNINDLINDPCFYKEENKPLSIVYRDIYWLYQELYFLNKKILILILPIQLGAYKLINNIHRFLCQKFNFNLIDMQIYYEKNNLEEFGNRIDTPHQQASIMKEFGRCIVDNIDKFNFKEPISIKNDNPEFKICTPKEMHQLNKKLQCTIMKNSMFNEITYRLNENDSLQFPFWAYKYTLIGMHTWSNYELEGIKLNYGNGECAKYCSDIKFKNKNTSINKEHAFLNHFVGFNANFIIDDQSFVVFNKSGDAQFKESHPSVGWRGYKKKVNHCDIISFFLASPEGNYHTEEIDFEALANENIEIPEEYNFNHLIPPIELYKEIIDEYCATMDPRKLASLQKQISVLTQEKQDLQNKFQNELNSLPAKKQRLELANLEQDLIIKKLES
ncbi:hypothetical protein, partial [Campylobacter sp. BCW_4332]|uniref:hypothetical protein n=1 Tax=Campylobacter sp. BCW_4332 TaxID=1903591 RepID=UPI000AC42E7C